MKKLYFKTKFSTVALILVLAISAILVVLPTATAQSTCATYAFIGATPNPVGIHQTTLLHIGITTQLGNVREGWEGLSVTITKPDGTTEKISNIRTDATGGTGIQYTPTMSGEYTLQTHFPEQVRETDLRLWGGIGLIPAGTVMLASDSEILTLVVQETPVEYYPGFQLPTFYWTRPINAQIREWATFGGSWAGFSMESNRFITSNDDAPEAAHILWTKEIAMGGLVGGEVQGMGGPVAYENGAAYEQKFGAPAILGGILFYNRFEERGGTDVEQDVVAVDLHTGEELWVRNWNNTRLDLAQNFYWQSYNYMGTFAYLWEVSGGRGVPVTWRAFDAFTGRWIYTMTNVPLTLGSYAGGFGSNSWFGSRNEMYAYEVDLNNGWMALWNSSRVVSDMGSWGPHGNTYDCSWDAPRHGGWEWNITIPTGLPGSVRGIELDERVVGANANTTEVTVWGFSLKPGQEGNMLFKNTWDAPAEWSKNQSISWSATSLVDNVGIVHSKETMNYWGFSLTTGKYLWGPTEPEQYLQYLGISTGVAYGRFYSTYMGGILYCYNITTGELLWKYEVLDPYNEILWSPNWPVRIQFITDGKIYLCEMEHSPNQPLPRGGPYLCLNATTGEKIWSISLMYYYRTNTLIGDNIIAMMNSYDQQIYAIGKGPSATTVTASPKVSVYGSSVVVEGMVTDISPGTQQYARTARFPNGVPAVSDDSMSAWMEYVYMQFDRPDDVEDDVEGVKVFLKIQDPNGDYYSTYVTTDINGRFSHMWAPAIAGEYKVTAMFEGSKSYYPSQDTTTFGVDPALDAEDVPSAAEIADTTVNRLPAYPAIPEIPAYLTIDIVILIIVAIGVVIGLIAYMSLRKQK